MDARIDGGPGRAVPSHPCKQPTSVSCTQRVNAAPGEPRTPRRQVRLSRLSRHDRASDSAQPALPPRLPLCSPRRNATGVEGVRRRELRIVRRDSAIFRSGGRPVYRKAGRLTPHSSVEVWVVGRSHPRFYWSNRVLMQRLAPLNATVGPPYFVALRIALAAAAGTTIQPRLPSRSTASVSRITTPAASADLYQASSIPPGLCVDSGPKAIRRLSRAENTG